MTMTPDETRAAIEAAKHWKRAEQEGTESRTSSCCAASVAIEWMLRNESELLALAEGQGAEDGIKRPVSVEEVGEIGDYETKLVLKDADGRRINLNLHQIKAALNRPALGAGAGIFEGGSWVLAGEADPDGVLIQGDRQYWWGHSDADPGVVWGDVIEDDELVWCDRHGLPLPVPQPPSSPTAGDGQGVKS